MCITFFIFFYNLAIIDFCPYAFKLKPSLYVLHFFKYPNFRHMGFAPFWTKAMFGFLQLIQGCDMFDFLQK